MKTLPEWFKSYGYDEVYGTKRLRRICLKTFARVLSTKRATVVTPYGDAGVEQFPAPYLESREGEDFVVVKLYGHTRLKMPTAEKAAIKDIAPMYTTAMRMSNISIVDTVCLRIITIQCMFRTTIAIERVKEKRKTRNAAIMVQRKFRWRFQKKSRLGLMVQCAWRRYLAYEELKFKKKEVTMAKKIQNNFRCFLGRMVLEEHRRVSQCSILDSSGDLNELFDASKALDGKLDSFWCSSVGNISDQWLSFDLSKKFDIGKFKILNPDNSSSPKMLIIENSDKVTGPWKHVQTIECKQGNKRNRWQSFDLPKCVSRYWRVCVVKNYGNTQMVSIVGLGFFVAKEITAHITEEPESLMISPGPPVGKIGGDIVLKCSAAGWPPPKYQWYKNGEEIDGESGQTLCITISSQKSKIFKRFRCIHCKKINTELPQNIYRVICSNCKYPFDFPEVEHAAFLRKPLQLEIAEVDMKLKQLRNSKNDLNDDNKALRNKIKRDEFAKDRGEEIKKEQEAEEEQIIHLEFMESLESMESRMTSVSLEDQAKDHNLSLKEYKKMMKEFSAVEEVVEDEGSLGSSSLRTGAGPIDGIADANATAPRGPPPERIVVEGASGPVSPMKANPGDDVTGGAADALVPTEAADNTTAGSKAVVLLGGVVPTVTSIDNPQGDQAAVGNDDMSTNQILMDFMNRIEAQSEPEVNEDEVKIEENEKELAEIEIKIQALEKKSRWLLRKRLMAGEHDPCKVHYDGEGVYQCFVSNVRGGEIVRTNRSRPSIIFVDDPKEQVIKVREEYHLKRRLRRRNWPKYLSLYGWFVEGNVVGDVIVRYHEGSVYDGPYVDERWLDYMGRTVDMAFEKDHWGVWLAPDDIVYEGPRVDNHFDETNIQGEYRVTYQNGEVYEGQYVDERRHGIGEYHFLDGSIYEGEYFKNKRQGFGVFTILDKSVYEGEWDRDYIHGEGIWRWADGSCYMGDNIDGERTGRGVYITDHGDVYVGEFKNNAMHGNGTFTYNDGTRYEGTFRENLREGNAVFTYPNGVKDIGEWRNDRRDGEFVVRRPVYGDDADAVQNVQWDDEIQHGIWDEGEFIEWLAPPVNPKATTEFIKLFEDNDEEYDGVYAMLIARKLPLVPHGIQETHPKVQKILKRIAREGGQLVAFDTYTDTKNKLHEIEPLLNDAKVEYRHYRTNEEHVDTVIAGVNRQIDDVRRKIDALKAQELVFETAIESFWLEDHEFTRDKFDTAVKNLEPLERNDWFQVRHYHEPPALIENVMSAVCMLMMEKDNWKGAQNLLGSSQQNRDDGDQESIWQEYDVKLKYMLKDFDVFARAEAPGLLSYVGHYLVDPRFKSDNYFLQSFGPAAVKLVEWIWATYAYVKKSREIKPKYEGLMAVKGSIGRFQQTIDTYNEKVDMYETRAKSLKAKVAKSGKRKDRWQYKYDKLEELLMNCQEMVTEYTSDDEHELDDYERMLLAEGEIKSTVETLMELMVQDLEDENEDPDPEEIGGKDALFKLIDDAVAIGRKRMFRLGDYKFVGGKLVAKEKPVDVWEIQERITGDVRDQINSVLNDYPDSAKWKMPDGSVVGIESIAKVIQHRWTAIDTQEALNSAESKWETIFPKNAAYMAVQSRTNFIMSEDAKKEAEIWMERHKPEVQWTEEWISNNFEEENHEETARVALEMRVDKKMGVDMMCQADVWCRLNRDAVLEELDRQNSEKARNFAEAHPDNTAEAALVYRNLPPAERQAAEENDPLELEEAEAWISLNLEAIVEEEDKAGAKLAEEFAERFPDTYEDEEGGDEQDGGAQEEKKASGTGEDGDKKEKKQVLKMSTAREAVRIKMDESSEKEVLDMALAWANREENKDKFYRVWNETQKELHHDDLVRGSNIKGLLEDVSVWHASL